MVNFSEQTNKNILSPNITYVRILLGFRMVMRYAQGCGGYVFSRCIFPKCIYPKCIIAKCTRLACLLSFASLFSSKFLNWKICWCKIFEILLYLGRESVNRRFPYMDICCSAAALLVCHNKECRIAIAAAAPHNLIREGGYSAGLSESVSSSARTLQRH